MNRQPFFYISAATIIGILIANTFPLEFSCIYYSLILLLLFFLAIFLFRNKINGSILLLLLGFMLLGFTNHKQSNKISENHYRKTLHSFDKVNTQFKILEEMKASAKYNKYIAEVQFVYGKDNKPKEIEGKTILYVLKKQKPFFVDDLLLAEANYFKIEEEGNQYKGYVTYLKRKKIFGNFFVKSILVYKETNSIFARIHKFKNNVTNKLFKQGYNKQVVQLIQSLLLGQRNEMDTSIIKSFQNLGIMHILSISGLHIVIVFQIILFLCTPLTLGFGGKKAPIFTALLFVVFYTFFVGLNPPVLRTTLMLLLYYGSYFLQRKPNIYHSLLLSAFILLCFNSNFLFDIGFQLSYTAVFFIVWMYSLFEFKFIKNKAIKYFSDIVSVSFAAQIGTLPLTLYYFHTTSLLFLVGNLLFIPFTFVFILLSFIVIMLSVLNISFPFLVFLVNQLVQNTLEIGFWLSDFPVFILEGVEISIIQVIILYLIITCLPLVFKKYTYQFKIIYLVLFLILLLRLF